MFANPINTNQYPDYYDTVPTPMDLGTIKRKLLGGVYATPADMMRDVGLVWGNAKTYFRDPTSDERLTVAAVEAAFGREWAGYF